MSTVFGTNDPTLSDHLKAFIRTPAGLVCGVIGEGSSRELTANWNSPFEQDSAGSYFEKAGGLVQEASDRTSQTTLNTTQVWAGTTPHTFALVLELYAVADPANEVQAAVIALEQAASPEMRGATPGGRVPPLVSLNVGRQIIYPECVIENVSKALDGPISADGYPLQGQVTLSLQTKDTVNASKIPATFG